MSGDERRRGRSSGPRPPWWPADEAWPPEGRAAWRGGPWRGGPWAGTSSAGEWGRRGGFMRRFGCLALVFVLLSTAGAALGLRALGAVTGLVASTPEERLLSSVALVLGIGAVLLVVRAFRRLAAPVGELVEAAGRVETGDYGVRVSERGPADVRSLARAFNAMSSRLESNETQRRTFLADVAHELRTPISVIQARLEAVLDGVHPADAEHLAPILDETRAMEGLVADLRTLALAEAGGLTLAPEPVDPQTFVNETIGSMADRATAAVVTVVARFEAGVPVIELDPARIRSVLRNLLANAIRHTPAGGTVTVDVSATSGGVRFAVRDTGPGIPPAMLPHVFERFVRDESSPGSGLGLAIARDLVLAHGGTIAALDADGGGATIRFELPVTPDAGRRAR